MFKPLRTHVEVKPLEQQTIIATKDVTYEEKGVVVSIGDEVEVVEVGWTVYFDSWLAARYTDNEGNARWLVPEENIRACETDG